MTHLNADTSVSRLAERPILVDLPYRKVSLSQFCSGTRYVKLVCLSGSELTAARKRRNSGGCVCAMYDGLGDSVHHKTGLVANPISDRQPV